MSSLGEKLAELTEKQKWPASISNWMESLDEENWELTWSALRNSELKTYSLFPIFRSEGLRCSKDTFTAFRNAVLAEETSESDFDVSTR